MIYEKDHHRDSPYVSVKTLIKPRKNRGLNTLSAITASNLAISQPGDPAELEADRMADQVVHNADVLTQSNQISPPVQTEPFAVTPLPDQESLPLNEEQTVKLEENPPSPKESKQLHTQRIAMVTATEANSSPPRDSNSQINNLNGNGSPLDKGLQDYFEPQFGADLSNVRIHTDSEAHWLAQSIHAEAFTYGNDIVFGQGQYQPDTTEGKKLIAHEVAHTLQQRTGASRNLIHRKEDGAGAVIPSFEHQAAEELKPLLQAAIEISQTEREKYFGRENHISELVNLIKNNYGEMYLAADTLRARALIRFFRDEDVLHSSDMGLGQILWMPKNFDFNEKEIAKYLKVTVKHKTGHLGMYDPSIVKEMMAYHVFWHRIYAQNPGQLVEGTEAWKKAPYMAGGSGNDYRYDAKSMSYIMDTYPEMYQADMLDTATTAQVKGIDAQEYRILSDVRTDFYQLSTYGEKSIEKEIRKILDERERSSKSLMESLSRDPGIIWDLPPLVDYTLKKLGYNKNSGYGKVIWDEFQGRKRDKAIWNWVLTGLGILLGIAGAVSLGLGYGLAAVILGSIGLGLGAYDLHSEITNYSLMNAASGSTYKMILSNKPSPLGIFIAIAGIALDVVDLAGEVGKVVSRISREISEEATEQTIRRSWKELLDKKIIGKMEYEDFLKVIKGAEQNFPKAFFTLPPNPAFYKLYAKDPSAFTKLFSSGKEEVLAFFGKYGAILTKEEIQACIDGGLPAIKQLRSVFRKNFQQFFEQAIQRVPSEYQSRVRAALKKMPRDRQEDAIILIQSISRDSKTIQEHHWIRQASIKDFPLVNTELKKYNIDLYEWQENLSLIAGHRSGHLGKYRKMVDDRMISLEKLIIMMNKSGNPLSKQEIVKEVREIIVDVKTKVQADYDILNNYKTIVLD